MGLKNLFSSFRFGRLWQWLRCWWVNYGDVRHGLGIDDRGIHDQVYDGGFRLRLYQAEEGQEDDGGDGR